MRLHTKKQYTIRNIPPQVDRVLRQRARDTGKSFNRVALEALIQGADEARVHHDLDFMIGSMSPEEAEQLGQEIARQRRIDPELWR